MTSGVVFERHDPNDERNMRETLSFNLLSISILERERERVLKVAENRIDIRNI